MKTVTRTQCSDIMKHGKEQRCCLSVLQLSCHILHMHALSATLVRPCVRHHRLRLLGLFFFRVLNFVASGRYCLINLGQEKIQVPGANFTHELWDIMLSDYSDLCSLTFHFTYLR